MSMLAEPKKRQKISVNPNGNSWSSDTSKFGQKLLEKMGWQKGKGLGLKESGDTSHVKVKMNMDSRGLGCTKKEADNWIAHQDDFSSLLAQLNGEHGASTTSDQSSSAALPPPPEAKSLFDKSKSSRKRVHYEKFTKGKDVSRYGGKSLDQIFGRRPASELASTASAAASPRAGGSNDSELNSDEDSPTEAATRADHDDFQGGNMVASSMNVADYFAKKMAARKQALAAVSLSNKRRRSVEEDAGKDGSRGRDTDRSPTSNGAGDVEAQAAGDDGGTGQLDASGGNDDVGGGGCRAEKKKKKKKKKEKKKPRPPTDDTDDEDATADGAAEH